MPAKHASAKVPETISGGIALTWYDKIFKPKTVTLENGKTVTRRASRGPVIAVLIIIVSTISIQVTGFDMTVLAENGGRFWDILFSMFPPNWDYMPSVWQPLFDTINMSLLGSFIGSVLVIPFAVAASTNIVHSKVVVALMRQLGGKIFGNRREACSQLKPESGHKTSHHIHIRHSDLCTLIVLQILLCLIQVMQNKTIHRIEGCTWVILTLLRCGFFRYDRHCQAPYLRSLAIQFRKARFLVLKHTCHIQICQSAESIGDTR